MVLFNTKDLIVSELRTSDAIEFHRICNQSFVLKWMDDWQMNLEQVKELISRFIIGYSIRNPEKHPFIMSLKDHSNQLVGICGFGPKEELGGETEIAYFIGEEYSNKGYMSQVIPKAIEYYFEMTNRSYLCAIVDELNIPSYKLLIKNGFQFYPIENETETLKSHYRRYQT